MRLLLAILFMVSPLLYVLHTALSMLNAAVSALPKGF